MFSNGRDCPRCDEQEQVLLDQSPDLENRTCRIDGLVTLWRDNIDEVGVTTRYDTNPGRVRRGEGTRERSSKASHTSPSDAHPSLRNARNARTHRQHNIVAAGGLPAPENPGVLRYEVEHLNLI
jgi:hypothetical protein